MDWLKSLFSGSSKTQAERTQALQPLSATNEIYLSDIFNISHAGIGLLNCDLHFVKVNHAFCELFGYSERLAFAQNDGFDTWEDFFNYFYPRIKAHRDEYYSGKIIHWTDLRY